ncbi:hypothetical protein HDA40_002479 [Hamadaea flava]|uniref:Uncharacterized protein n=1 Tax=Hamadaea flava TaxID=1742688 RepID=A0ABV8LL95_9ACTN|nr:hypothetical protein [Hamadaea flava]MCP2323972.1 hypothetical protein [Hamadaea flava]
MSQEERDARLGLTGLTPEQRRQRIAQLERELAERYAAAKADLAARRAARPKSPEAGTR